MKAIRVFSPLLVFFTFFLIAGNALAMDVQIPAPIGDIYVQDFANVLNETEKAELINLGRSIEDQTTAQVAVLTVETIGEWTIEEFANKAFRQYGIGDEKKNNGVLLVLAMKEHKVRIAVGYGLEGRIPDGKAGRILDEYAIPNLKNQQSDKAVIDTYKVLADEVLAEYGISGQKSASESTIENEASPLGGLPTYIIIIVVAILIFFDFKFFGGTFTFLVLSILSRGGKGGGPKGGGGGSSGGGGAGRGW